MQPHSDCCIALLLQYSSCSKAIIVLGFTVRNMAYWSKRKYDSVISDRKRREEKGEVLVCTCRCVVQMFKWTTMTTHAVEHANLPCDLKYLMKGILINPRSMRITCPLTHLVCYLISSLIPLWLCHVINSSLCYKRQCTLVHIRKTLPSKNVSLCMGLQALYVFADV